jgi:hypothetical protein
VIASRLAAWMGQAADAVPGLPRRAPAARPPRGPRPSASLPGTIRPFEDRDLPALAALHRRVFGEPRAGREPDELLAELLARNPWRDPALPSLVYEERGEVLGSLGVMPRPMWLDGEPVTGALSHNFMLAPERRSTMAAIEMLRVFLEGPQEFSFTFGNDLTRRLWRTLGVEPSIPFSLRFVCLLRPAAHVLALLGRRGFGRDVALLRRLGALVDAATAAGEQDAFRPPESRLDAAPLDAATLADCIDRFSRRRALRPSYDPAALDWMLGVLERRGGELHRALLLRRGTVVGWHLYLLPPDGVAELVQIGGSRLAAPELLDHLRRDAWRRGAVAIAGQVEPTLLAELTDRLAFVHRARSSSWLLAHGRERGAVRALQAGDAFLTRLEAEWWA